LVMFLFVHLNFNQQQATVDLFALSTDEPSRLKIPSISVDASVEHLGLTNEGAMDVPEDKDDVAWYKFGPHPGENGNAVIAGHYGWKENTPAVFDNLHKLKIGDKIYVENKNGSLITFVVREIQIYDKDADASKVFWSDDNKAHLNLITCTGEWSDNEKTSSHRLIVFADKKE